MKYITNTTRMLLLPLLTLGIFNMNFAANNSIPDTNKVHTQIHRPFQFTFFAPLSTNGIDAYKISNNASINMLTGVNGGLNGAEFTGLIGVNLGNVKGAQFAGLLNANTKSTKGAQFAGWANYSQGTLNGLQAAGLSNIAINNTTGAQVGGMINVIVGEATGAQLAGIASVTTKSSNVYQFSGIANGVSGNNKGLQAAGIVNYSMGNEAGQLSGILNANIGNLKGIQISGIANFNSNKVTGAQISSILNFTRVLNGFQLGLVNYTDSLEKGAVIGLLSFVRNGYRSYEFSTSESLYGVFSFRTGTDNFYNILSFGASGRLSTLYWGFGYGIGTKVQVNDKVHLNIEGLTYHINEDSHYTHRLNSLNKLQILATIPMGNYMKMSVGPTWNVFVNEIDVNNEGRNELSQFAPYSVFNKTYNNDINIKMYPGFTLGVKF